MAAFQNWKAALEKLISAIDYYRDTSFALETAFNTPHEHFPTTLSLEETILDLYGRGKLIRSKSDELCEANSCLDRIRNRSRRHVPINALPPEILARIFTIASGASCFARPEVSGVGYSIRNTSQVLLALTQVHSDWRRIMVNIPSLWSHIDIHRDNECMLPNVSLWLDRARNSPLSVHITTHFPEITMPRLRQTFVRFGAANSLYIGPSKNASWPVDVLTLWMNSVTPGNLRLLSVLGSYETGDIRRLGWVSQALGQETLQTFLAPIRSLRLHAAYFDWDSPVYHGLVNLKISGMDSRVYLTRGQLVGILRACPELRVLQLEGMNFQGELQESYDPVLLDKLEVLDVSRMNAWPFKQDLSIIAPGLGELSVRIDLREWESIPVLQTFSNRSDVVRLFLHGLGLPRAGLSERLMSLSNLRVLLLDFGTTVQSADHEAKLDAFVGTLGLTNSAIYPHLRTLYLLDCKPGLGTVKKLVESCGIQKLRILSSTKETNREIEQWSERFAQDTKQQSNVNIKALIEDWYEHMW